MEDPHSIGAPLREARLRQNLEIAECAHATRIRERYLVAIEDGRFESLPDPAYVSGFVRAYDDLLPGPAAGRARASHRRPVTVRATRITARGAGRRRPWWRSRTAIVVAVIVVVLVVLAIVGVDLPLVG